MAASTRDFVYVADVVAHLLAAMARLEGEPGALVCNVCTGRETSVLALAETIAQLCDRPALIEPGPPRAGDIRRSVGSAARARALLSRSASVELAEGLGRTLSVPA